MSLEEEGTVRYSARWEDGSVEAAGFAKKKKKNEKKRKRENGLFEVFLM